MPAITEANRNECSVGNITMVTVSCLSIANGDWWYPKLSTIYQVFVGGIANGVSVDTTVVGTLIGFTVTGGPALTVDVMAIGLP